MHTYVHTHTHTHTHAHTRTYMHAYMHAYIHTHTHLYAHIYIYVCTYHAPCTYITNLALSDEDGVMGKWHSTGTQAKKAAILLGVHTSPLASLDGRVSVVHAPPLTQ